MGKKTDKANEAATELPEFKDNGGALPGEEVFSDLGGDSNSFVTLKAIGDTFTGVFLRKVAKGMDGLKHPGLLFAEYPSGEPKVLPDNWSIGNKIAQLEDSGSDPCAMVLRITLTELRMDKDDPKKVAFKGYKYAGMPVPARFQVKWDEQFPEQPAHVGQ